MEGYFIYVANKLDSIRFGPSSGGKLFDLREVKTLSFWRAVSAEFLATMMFVFLGSASAIFDSDKVKISLAFGLAIMAMIQMFGHVSGGHINPAVSIAMAVSMNISVLRAFLYVVAQTIGAIIGAFILKGVTPSAFHGNLAVTNINSALGVTQAQGFGVELLLTFTLVFVIYGTVDANRPNFGSASLAIGLTVAMGHFSAISYTGASMNPARSLGSAVASNSYANHWIYWVGPIAGGVLASVLYKWVFDPYRGVPTMAEGAQTLLQDDSFVAIPRDYFKEGKKENMNASSNL
ncbi:aquaporin-4-like isoform X1 [Haliotis rufescens]|uniref:aquaporin-4-like isoform X1 n=1 Tax=Haliotis rufescens TaxID=6454 RepID=UPI001EB04ED7|nr:aquaporin-4-like isoform X1 [Haliotis rufescens]